ncbi:hypothetical protein ECE50_026930 [Chitinophaga sp. Mgbs1]|uniref:Uncharacterized protein n=1 Tax=Chitinophaga solisilvae TaxID=1233460 RepID=A0A3S1CZJ0_9BACT|nr:hypothetical protein [Chitinophaga solisilvae]
MKRTIVLILWALSWNVLQAQDSMEVMKAIRATNILDNGWNLRTSYIGLTFKDKENTVGSPYLYPEWRRMWLDSMDNKPVKHSVVYEANLDLEKNELIIKGGDGKAYTPETRQVQMFHFQRGDTQHIFVGLRLGDSYKFVQELAAGKYCLVKEIKISFARADFVDKGMIQSGKNYDEYRREPVYYLVKDGIPEKAPLRKKSFLSLLDKDPQAAATSRKFLSSYNGPFDETAMVKTVEAINK